MKNLNLALVMLLIGGTASADIDQQYNDCVQGAHDDAGSSKCLERSAAEMDAALADIVRQLVGVLDAKAGDQPKARMLEDAHAKWLPSRDADCALQAAVTMDDPADRPEAVKLCAYQANVPRLRQYERFLGFLK